MRRSKERPAVNAEPAQRDDPRLFRHPKDVGTFLGLGSVKILGPKLRTRGCQRKATAAVARKFAVIMHEMWFSDSHCRCDSAASETERAARAASKERKLLGAAA